MTFTKLVPNVFYINIKDALTLFIDCLDFKIVHDELKSETPFCVIEKDGLRINFFENVELAKEHNPEFRLVTNNIDKVYKKISLSHAEFLHPNLSKISIAEAFTFPLHFGKNLDALFDCMTDLVNRSGQQPGFVACSLPPRRWPSASRGSPPSRTASPVAA